MRKFILAAIMSLATLSPALAECLDPGRQEVMMGGGTHRFPEPIPVPDMPFQKPDGTFGALSEMRGKPTLVSFWFPQCPFCQIEMPTLNQLRRDRADDDRMNFLPISIRGSHEAVTEYLDKRSYEAIEPFRDVDVTMFLTMCLAGTPSHALLDAEGRMIAAFTGPRIWTDERVLEQLETLAFGG